MPAALRRWMCSSYQGVGGHDHVAVGVVSGRLRERRAGDVGGHHLLQDVHLRRIDRDGHLVGFRRELGERMARVVGEPLRRGALVLRREGDRAAHLQDHVRHGDAKLAQQLVEARQALGALAVLFAHVRVQDRGARVVAVHRLCTCSLIVTDVLGKSFGIHSGPWRGGDDEVILVFGEEGSVLKVHFLSLRVSSGRALLALEGFELPTRIGCHAHRASPRSRAGARS